MRGGVFFTVLYLYPKAALLYLVAYMIMMHILRFKDGVQHDYGANPTLFEEDPPLRFGGRATAEPATGAVIDRCYGPTAPHPHPIRGVPVQASQAPEAGPSNILDQLQVSPDAATPGRYHAHLDPAWAAPVFPSGGVVSGAAMRAMQAACPEAHHRVRTLTTMFASAVRDGDVEIDVDVVRHGKRMSHLQARVRNPGSHEPGHVVIAAFGEARPGFDFEYTRAPEVDGPESYPERAEPPPDVATFRAGFFEQTDSRSIDMHASWEKDWEGGRAEATRWIRYARTPRQADGAFDACALPGLADTMPSAVGQYLGPDSPFFHCPSVDLTVHFLADTHSDWLLTRTRCHWAGDGYASAETQLWDEERRLVGHATQLMLIRLVEPEAVGAGPRLA